MPVSHVASPRAGRFLAALIVSLMLAASLPAAVFAVAPSITSANNATFTIGAAGSFTVTTIGTPVSTIVQGGAALPSGVTFVDNGDGTATLGGTPAAGTAGIYFLTFTASNGDLPNAIQAFTVTVNAAPDGPPTITSASSTTFTVGAPGSFTVTTVGSPPAALGVSGSLPSGVSFTDIGFGIAILAGTPSTGTAGVYPITLTAANGNLPNATQSFTLSVVQPPTFTSAGSATFAAGSPGSFTVTTTGAPTPAITSSGSLPSGLSFVDNGNGTATLSGTPLAGTGGSYALTWLASNGIAPDGTQSFTLTVNEAPIFSSGSITTFTVGVASSFQVTTSGVPAAAISASGALPGGLTFTDNGDGTATISGTPAGGTTGGYALALIAANGVLPNANQSFTLTVAPPAPPVVISPSVTINQATGQADPTAVSPINFTVVFSASVNDFATGDVALGGTAGGPLVGTVTGTGTTYNVAVAGMSSAGTVIATVPAGVASSAGQANQASTSTDNTVTWLPTASVTLSTSAPTPPGAQNPVILWGQGFTLTTQFGTDGASKQFQLQGSRDLITWTTIATQTTDATGRATLLYTPVTNLYYRAVFAGTPDLAAANSNQVRTVVRQLGLRPTNNGSIKTISRNSSVTFTMTARPARPELQPAQVSFYLYKRVSGVWTRISTRNVFIDGAGLARTTWTFASTGDYYVRGQVNPTAYNANSVMTAPERYNVR